MSTYEIVLSNNSLDKHFRECFKSTEMTEQEVRDYFRNLILEKASCQLPTT